MLKTKKAQIKLKIIDEMNRLTHDSNWVKAPPEQKKLKKTKVVVHPPLKKIEKEG